VVPNAKVTFRNVATGSERLTATDGRGFYSPSGLPAGTYSVVVEAANLAKLEIRAEATVSARVEANFTLTVGVTSTVIEVLGEGGVAVNTETATIGTVMDSQQIQQLPTLKRNPYTFAQYVGTASRWIALYGR
jgi:carboxypeptidase family protein